MLCTIGFILAVYDLYLGLMSHAEFDTAAWILDIAVQSSIVTTVQILTQSAHHRCVHGFGYRDTDIDFKFNYNLLTLSRM